MTKTYNMLTIFSPCEGATDGPRTGAHDQGQQDYERVHGVHKLKAKVGHRGNVPIFLRTAQPIHEKGWNEIILTGHWPSGMFFLKQDHIIAWFFINLRFFHQIWLWKVQPFFKLRFLLINIFGKEVQTIFKLRFFASKIFVWQKSSGWWWWWWKQLQCSAFVQTEYLDMTQAELFSSWAQ